MAGALLIDRRANAPPPSPLSHPPFQRADLTADERQELQEAFQMFDAEATGRIDLHELKVR